MIPTVGRIVHYTNLGDRDGKYPPEVQGAMITKVTPKSADSSPVEEGRYAVSLHVFYETGDFMMKDVPYTEDTAGSEGARGHWTWSARV
jgi:hypothetical protein